MYLWNRDFRPSQLAALGSLDLRRGMSVLGRVVTASGPVDLQRVEVEMRPLVSREAGAVFEARLRKLVIPGRVNPAGYFHFDAVAAGTYTLDARQPGFETASVSPLTIRDGEDLELPEALVLEHVGPAQDSRSLPGVASAARVVMFRKGGRLSGS